MLRSASVKLRQVMENGDFVRLKRRFENDYVRGFILGVERSFFLVGLVSDRLWNDGFECFRVPDITALKIDPDADFALAALKKRRQKRPRRPKIDLRTAQRLLQTAGAIYPLVGIHCEGSEPGVCHIGRVLRVSKAKVTMQEILPGAVWKTLATDHELRDITRVNFGGDYEDALRLVGGKPPPVA